MKTFMKILLLIVVTIITASCTITNQYGPYYGKVVDAETKEPIEGAAVLIVFYTATATVGGAVYHYADSLETVTDKKGEFRIEAKRILRTGVMQRWDKYGHVTIFKPGYGCYPNHRDVKPLFTPNGTMPENYNVTFELPLLKTKKEREDSPCGRNLNAPLSKQKHLIELLNQERRYLGYDTFYEEH